MLGYIYLELSGSKKGVKLVWFIVALDLIVASAILNVSANNHYFTIIENLKLLSIKEVSVIKAGDVLKSLFAFVILISEIVELVVFNKKDDDMPTVTTYDVINA